MMQPGASRGMAGRKPRVSLLIVGLLLYGLAVAGYFVSRYGSQWAEGDTARLTQAVEVLRDEGALHPLGVAYSYGFAYPAVSVALLSATGVEPQALQTMIYPFLAMLVLGLTSLIFFFQVAGDRYVAALGTLLLFLQPDVLFVTLRGSHEKLIWPLTMIALALLYRSVGQPLRVMAIHIGLFYLVIFAMITTNVFFASVFLTAVVLSLFLGSLLIVYQKRLGQWSATHLNRLIYVSGSCGVLLFVFMAYIYPLSLTNLRQLRSIVEKVSALLLSFEIKGSPYEYIPFAWVSPQAYWALTAFTWLLIITSFLEWLRRGRDILSGRAGLSLRESLDWLLYAGFALQLAASVLVDFSGALAGNLQLRVFPGFTVVAVILLARGLRRLLARPGFQGRVRRVALMLAGLAVAWFSLASVFKASSEPVWSNIWVFYTVPEAASLSWIEENLRYGTIWTGFNERIIAAFELNYKHSSANANIYSAFDFKPGARYVLFSETERLRGFRMGLAMPPILSRNLVYDNGEVRLYHKRSLTPYQK